HRVGRAGHDRRPHAGAPGRERPRRHHDAQAHSRRRRERDARQRAQGHHPRPGTESLREAADHRPRLLSEGFVSGRKRDITSAHARASAPQGLPVPQGTAGGSRGGVSPRDGTAGARRRRPLAGELRGAMMAEIVLGLATSHTPMLTLPAELWSSYARNDERNRELAFPPHGVVMPYQEGLTDNAPELRAKFRGT